MLNIIKAIDDKIVSITDIITASIVWYDVFHSNKLNSNNTFNDHWVFKRELERIAADNNVKTSQVMKLYDLVELRNIALKLEEILDKLNKD